MVMAWKYQCVGCKWAVRLDEEVPSSGIIHGEVDGPNDWEVDLAVTHSTVELSGQRFLRISTLVGHRCGNRSCEIHTLELSGQPRDRRSAMSLTEFALRHGVKIYRPRSEIGVAFYDTITEDNTNTSTQDWRLFWYRKVGDAHAESTPVFGPSSSSSSS